MKIQPFLRFFHCCKIMAAETLCRSHLLTFFIINFSETLSECQMVWIQIRTDILPVLIVVQTVCQGYQQTTKAAASKERAETCSN